MKFPSLNLQQKAESIEVLDKGLTTNIFIFIFLVLFQDTSAVFSHPNRILFTFAPPDQLSNCKFCVFVMKILLLFMINNLDKDSRKAYNCFLLSISKADFKDLFWEKQSLFMMTFVISNFFLNSSRHKARLSSCWLSQLTSQESS